VTPSVNPDDPAAKLAMKQTMRAYYDRALEEYRMKPPESYRETVARYNRLPWLLKSRPVPNYVLVCFFILLVDALINLIGGSSYTE
jgi:hypothetical protein